MLRRMDNETVVFLSNKKILTIVIFVLAIVVIPSVYFYYRYQSTASILKTGPRPIKKETQALIDKVNKLIELPKDELPTVATVTDKSKLKNQPIFVRAENGDKLLIYAQAKRAILYRPSTNRIVDVIPISTSAKDQTQVAGASSEGKLTPANNKVKVAIYNGTDVTGLTSVTQKQLEEKMPQVEVVERVNAKENYGDTLVVDLKGSFKSLTKELAQFVSGQVSSMPSGEATPEADILIILGQ